MNAGTQGGSEDTAGQEPRGLCNWFLPPHDPECEGSRRGGRIPQPLQLTQYSQGVLPH